MNRKLPALIGAAALLTATLAGCTGGSGFGACDPKYAAGDASGIVTGSAQNVDFPTPLVTKKTEVSVIQTGDGALVQAGQQVDFTQAIYYGKDGSAISTAAPSRTETGLTDDTVSEAMVCAHVGDRIAVVSTVEAAFGKGAGGTQYADSDTLVIVLDITGAYLGKANGFNLLPQDGMPVVVTAVDGTPAIALDFVSKPAETRVETVKAGDGRALKTGDSAVLQVRAWTWPDTETDDPTELMVTSQNSSQQPLNTWAVHQALNFPVGDSTAPLFPPGVAKALVGAKVGSQLLIVVPPGDGQYPTIPSNLPGLTTDQTTIWVIDVLGVQKKS
ncbi:MAG: FKBP-type peptidyl-prolyl cis-trans isomerase [Pseudolysinimonas sp.]